MKPSDFHIGADNALVFARDLGVLKLHAAGKQSKFPNFAWCRIETGHEYAIYAACSATIENPVVITISDASSIKDPNDFLDCAFDMTVERFGSYGHEEMAVSLQEILRAAGVTSRLFR